MSDGRRPLHVDARRHVEGRLFPRGRPARRHRRARRLPAARHGLARSAPDRRHGRRRSADLARSRWCRSRRATGVDVDYLFLQVFVDQAIVTDAQNCGNILAGVGPFAIERGLVAATGDETRVAIFMENTGQVAVATVQTPGGGSTYDGDARDRRRAGHRRADPARVPRHRRLVAAARCCRPAMPSTRSTASRCTLIDNGMPCVVLRGRGCRRHRL